MSYYNSNRRPAAIKPGAQYSSIPGMTDKDITLSSPPDDSISDLSWSPTADHLAVAAWDGKVRIYNLTNRSGGEAMAAIPFEKPVLSCTWSNDGNMVVGAGADNTALLLDLCGNATAQTVAAHDAPVKVARFFSLPSTGAQMLATGSWDKTVKYWDLRQSTPAATLSCQDKVYSMDVKDNLLMIATAERYVNAVDLNNPTKFFKTQLSPLAHQTRVISCFTDSTGWAIGSIEGRCGFEYIDPKRADKKFTFRCHRSESTNGKIDIFSINAISLHPLYPSTFTTAGSDGTFSFWDKDARNRLKSYESVGAPITATAFNKDGKTFAYAVSYDWSKGHAFNSPQHVNKVMLHATSDEEVKSKSTATRR